MRKRRYKRNNRFGLKRLEKNELPPNEKLLLHVAENIGVERTMEILSRNFELSRLEELFFLAEKEKEQDVKIKQLEERINEMMEIIKNRNLIDDPAEESIPTPKLQKNPLNTFYLWNQVLWEIQSQISKPSYETWIKGTVAKVVDDDMIIVFSKNKFQADWLEQRYKDIIFRAVKVVAGHTYDIEFAVMKSETGNSFPDFFS